jgi:hypothetical protein
VSTELRTLRVANEALSKRRRAKRTRVRQGSALTIEDARDVLAQKDAEEQARRDKCSEGESKRRGSRLGDTVALAESLVTMRELVKKI